MVKTPLGKVSISTSPANYVSSTPYDNLTTVYDPVTNASYISRKDGNVDALTNRLSWQYLCRDIGTISDNNFTDTYKTKLDGALTTVNKNVSSGYVGIGSDGNIDNVEFINLKSSCISTVVNVKYPPFPLSRAIGDGVADDTAAIQACVNYVNSKNGGVITFPSGIYLLNSVNSIDTNCHILLSNCNSIRFEGCSPDRVDYPGGSGVRIKANTTNKDAFRITDSSSNITWNNLTITRISGATLGGNGIHFYNHYGIPNCGGYNLSVVSQFNGLYADTARPQLSRWNLCEFSRNINNGVEFVMTNDEIFSSCFFESNTLNGIKIGGGTNQSPWYPNGSISLLNCVVYGNTGWGVLCTGSLAFPNLNLSIDGGIYDTNGTSLIGGISVDNTWSVRIRTQSGYNQGHGIYLGSGAKEVVLDGCSCSDNALSGICVDSGAKYISIINPVCLSNGAGQSSDRTGIAIKGDVQYVSISGGILGNGEDLADRSIVRHYSSNYGITVSGSTGLVPDYITAVGMVFPQIPNDYNNRYTVSGTVGTHISILDTQNTNGIISELSNIGTKNSGWDSSHFIMGTYHMWVDASGKLRIKSSAPTSDIDGTIVGTQV